MKNRSAGALALAVLLALGACSSGPEATDASSPTTNPSPTSTVQDIREFGGIAPIEAGTYSIDPDIDPSTPLRVVYEVPEGWSSWDGAVKFSDVSHVAVTITTVTNLVTHGCTGHSWQDPPVGPSVGDLATALANLRPFKVTSPPEDVTLHGYAGKHLEWTVPDLEVRGEGDHAEFADCTDGNLKSWVAAIDAKEGVDGDAFYGYNAEPGSTEEFWILDVDGTRLMIASLRFPSSKAEDVAEMRAVLDSIRIEP